MKHTAERWEAREEARAEFYRKLAERDDCDDMADAMRKHAEAQQVVKDFRSKWG